VNVHAPQRGQLTPPEAAEYCQQDEDAVALSHGICQSVDLTHCQHMPLRRAVLPRSADPARVSADDAVVHSGVHNGAEQPVGLGSRGGARARVNEILAPSADLRVPDLGDGPGAKHRQQMAVQQVAVDLDRAPAQARPFFDPGCGVLAERDEPIVRVDPVVIDDVCFCACQPSLGLSLGRERVRSWAHNAIRPPVASLPLARRQDTDSTESTATPFDVAHYAALLRRRTTGSTTPDAMNSFNAVSGMRTCRPTRTKRIRRSAMSRRGNRSVVLSNSAASVTVSSRSAIMVKVITPLGIDVEGTDQAAGSCAQ